MVFISPIVKSTLLRLASKILDPSKGTVEYRDQREPLIGFVFQEPTLMPWRDVLSNVILPMEIKHNKNQLTKDYALEWLERVGLKGKENSYPD